MCGVWTVYDVAGVGGGEFAMRLVSRQRVAPLYWRSDTHTHCCTTLDGLDSDLHAVYMDLNLMWINYKVKILMHCGNIDWSKICERTNNANSLTNTFSNSPPATCHTTISAKQLYTQVKKLLSPSIANVKAGTLQAKASWHQPSKRRTDYTTKETSVQTKPPTSNPN
jgi:hypothetical protein